MANWTGLQLSAVATKSRLRWSRKFRFCLSGIHGTECNLPCVAGFYSKIVTELLIELHGVAIVKSKYRAVPKKGDSMQSSGRKASAHLTDFVPSLQLYSCCCLITAVGPEPLICHTTYSCMRYR